MSGDGGGPGQRRPEDLRRATERIEREELARGEVPDGGRAAVPRPASTIVLARTRRRRGDGPFEVLLLERPQTARFAAGAFVFPGGVIDDGDAAPGLRSLLPAAVGTEEKPALAAGLRELFEETGILLGDVRVPREDAARARRALLGGRATFEEVTDLLGLRFARLRVAYLSRWVTPARFARRYDTRFFLAESGPAVAGTDPELTDELSGYVWLSPAEAVRRFVDGLLPLLFPTRTTLSRLAAFPDLEAAFAACAAAEVLPLEPRLLVRGDSVRPVLPGDPEYAEAT